MDYPFLALHSAHSLSADIFHFHIMVYAFILFHMCHPPILPFSFSFLFNFLSFLILIIFLEIFLHGRLNKVERSLAPLGIQAGGSVPPAVRVLSPAWAPLGLHRALFMNSVSHGKIWTENAASPLNKQGMFGWYLSKNPPLPPPPPPPPPPLK